MFPRRAMLLRPGLTGSLLTGAAAGCGSEAIAGVPSGTGGLTGHRGGAPARPIAGAPGGLELTEEEPVGLSGGTAMEFTEDLDPTIGYYDIATEDRIALTGKIEMPWASAAGSDWERRAFRTRCRKQTRRRRRARETFARRPLGTTTAPPGCSLTSNPSLS